MFKGGAYRMHSRIGKTSECMIGSSSGTGQATPGTLRSQPLAQEALQSAGRTVTDPSGDGVMETRLHFSVS